MARLAGMELRERWADWDRSPFTSGEHEARVGLAKAVTRPSDSHSWCDPSRVFFRLSSLELWLIVAGVVFVFVAAGYGIGRTLRKHSETLREPVGTVQGALLALVGLTRRSA